MKRYCFFPVAAFCCSLSAFTQLKWVNVDSLYQPLPPSVHVYKTTDSLGGKPNIAYYVSAELKDKNIFFDADTTYKRRFTPAQFYQKNNQPLVVVNCTFFSFQTNQNLNVVIKNGELAARNIKTVAKKYTDTIINVKVYRSAMGVYKNRNADVAWIKSDSSLNYAEACQSPPAQKKWWATNKQTGETIRYKGNAFKKWKVLTAVGGGPVLLQHGKIFITNEYEMMFTGNAINDKHPRTAMGYTKDNKLIILVIQGRFPGTAEGATLAQEAQILKDLGCWEALNLDGGGSSCMLVNGKETIRPSDAAGQRAVPAVFLIKQNNKSTIVEKLPE
jgi:exopolysaccharide biosynthesis protein